MRDLSWKLKQFVRKLVPLTIIGALLYGGFTLYKQGTFRRGLRPALGAILHKVPYFGSRFRHYHAPGESYAHSGRHRSRRYSRRYSRRHGHRGPWRHSRRHRRHHR